MLINRLHIKGYKSLVDIDIFNLEPFCVFFGTNASGKSNIFELLELLRLSTLLGDKATNLFGNLDEMFSFIQEVQNEQFSILLETNLGNIEGKASKINKGFNSYNLNKDNGINKILRDNTSRIFINHKAALPLKDNQRLSSDAMNLESVLKRILDDLKVKDEFIEWMNLLIPEFANVEFIIDEYTGENRMMVYEKYCSTPFTANLISDGTRNILSIFTAIYQTSEPQFLFIEEPENGLNPKIVRELAKLLREKCIENGSNVWVNTHSQTFVSEITTSEAILVDKIEGKTRIKQLRDFNTYSLKVDEAWLLNMFDGGLPW
jgi:predicted ATPase